ncbi:hypothetical protein EMIHUDRAFT_66979, partial [Emiliania huxleyi CCMP1516]|uniref:Protein kinase domain-containing protein n=2 Tax=Emiliania huxleyi TaxID=2903 RepID=A0A0D3INR1_EMIH1
MRAEAEAAEVAAAEAEAEAAAVEAAVAAVAAAKAPEPAEADAPPAAVPLDELIAATDGFAEARKVGEGGFGRVYHADALPSLPRVASGFAVKTALVGVGAQGLAELQSEVRTLSAACHPSLLPLLGVCLAPARACLVYPLCRGGSLEDRLYRSPAALQRLRMLGFETAPPPLSSAARLRVLRDAASALHYLHTRSPMILHRDVSAGNILLDERGNGYLADVGLARAAEATAGGQVSHLSTQRIFGKPGYMDPIILNDGQASQLTDGFALGITLLVALTGRGAL